MSDVEQTFVRKTSVVYKNDRCTHTDGVISRKRGDVRMRYVKLQFGCLLVILYIVITYIRAIKRGRSKTSRQYNLLMLVAPIAVIFDGITAWTVNHMDIVPSGVNRLAQILIRIWHRYF